MIVRITWGTCFCHWETSLSPIQIYNGDKNSYLQFAMRITENAFCMFRILQALLACAVTHGIRANFRDFVIRNTQGQSHNESLTLFILLFFWEKLFPSNLKHLYSKCANSGSVSGFFFFFGRGGHESEILLERLNGSLPCNSQLFQWSFQS